MTNTKQDQRDSSKSEYETNHNDVDQHFFHKRPKAWYKEHSFNANELLSRNSTNFETNELCRNFTQLEIKQPTRTRPVSEHCCRWPHCANISRDSHRVPGLRTFVAVHTM